MSNVQAVFAATNPEELAVNYDKWAMNYESDLKGHAGPEDAAEQFLNYVNKSARILDAGCGTGLVGQLLSERGYSHIEGLDLSLGMLEQAKQKGCYQGFYQLALGEPLTIESDSFDAIVSVGVFVMGHAKSNSFDELIRITKPKGHIIFTLRPEFYENTDFKTTMQRLETEGLWTLTHVTEPFHGRFKEHPEVYLQVWVFQVN
jgi:SAM-dependent methyltransferase